MDKVAIRQLKSSVMLRIPMSRFHRRKSLYYQPSTEYEVRLGKHSCLNGRQTAPPVVQHASIGILLGSLRPTILGVVRSSVRSLLASVQEKMWRPTRNEKALNRA